MKEKGENERGEELNAAAKLSVWKGITPGLNIAARLGRHRERWTERFMHLNTEKKHLLQNLILFLKAHQKSSQNVSSYGD